MQNITCVLLIDKRLANYDEIIASANAVTACVVFDYNIDTFDTLRTRGIDRITPENRMVCTWDANVEVETDAQQQQQQQQQQVREYRNIGLMQHNATGAQYFAMANELGCRLDNVAESDPSLTTWANYIEFINTCVRDYGLQTYDMMACALYSDANWKYAIDEMTVRCGVTIRASLDNTGTATLGGNWFLETSGVKLTTVYFTEEIYKWKYVLAVVATNIFPNYFVLRTGSSTWRPFIPDYPNANITTNIQTWNPDEQFYGSIEAANQIARQFSYFAGYWLNRNKVTDTTTQYSVAGYHVGSKGTFTFQATEITTDSDSVKYVTKYKGKYSTYLVNLISSFFDLIPQADGITAGRVASRTEPPLKWFYAPQSTSYLNSGPFLIQATSQGNGTLTYSSSSTGVATVTPNATGGVILTFVSVGTTTIRVSQAADLANYYNAPPDITTVVTVIRTPATLMFLKTAFYAKYVLNITISIPATFSTNNSDTGTTVTHASGNSGVATVTTSANVGTITVKGLGTTTITSTLAATANFDAVTVTSITITVVGSGSTLTGATMTSVDLSETNLTGSVFSGCDLTSANLYGATFNENTDLRGSTLTSLKSGRINGFTTLLPAGYKMI